MSKQNFFSFNSLYWLMVAALAGLLFLPQLLNEGMFFDGLAYSTIAFNMANGDGNIWAPILSKFMWNPFYGHPPLVMYLESFFFRILGDGWFTERWYCLFVFLLSALLIHKIWHEIIPKFRQLSWLPVLLWLISPGIYTFYSRNLLEPTMGVFTLLAMLLYLISLRQTNWIRSYAFELLAVFSIVCAFLSKGFPGLFPLALPILYGLIVQKLSFKKSAFNNFRFMIFFMLMASGLMLFNAPRTAMLGYFNTQIFSSVSGAGGIHPDGHLHIIWVFFEDISYMAFLTFGLLVLAKKRFHISTPHYSKAAIFLLLMGIAAAFPVAFSPKQSSFYILACFAPMALGFVGLKADNLNHLFQRLEADVLFKKAFAYIVGLFVIITIVINLYAYKVLRPRDAHMITDVIKIHEYVKEGAKLGSKDPGFQSVTSIHAYLQRYAKIALDTSEIDKKYILRIQDTSNLPQHDAVDLDLKMFKLYEYRE